MYVFCFLALAGSFATEVWQLKNRWDCIQIPLLNVGSFWDQNLGAENSSAAVKERIEEYLSEDAISNDVYTFSWFYGSSKSLVVNNGTIMFNTYGIFEGANGYICSDRVSTGVVGKNVIEERRMSIK